MRLLGYRLDHNGEQMLLAVHRKQYYVRSKGEDRMVQLSYEMVRKGTYAENVVDVPYFVIDNHVYPLKSFTPLDTRRGL